MKAQEKRTTAQVHAVQIVHAARLLRGEPSLFVEKLAAAREELYGLKEAAQ